MNLKEGHGGIFEVAIDDQVIYTNLKECGRLPEHEEIFQKIREYQGRPQKQPPSAYRGEQDAQAQRGEAGTSCSCCSGETSKQPEDSSGSCPSPQDGVSGGGGTSSGSRSKTFVFVLVMLIAVGVGGYSFSKRFVVKSQDLEQPLITSTSKGTPGLSWRNPATIELPSGAGAASCGVTLSSLKALDDVAADKEAVFVLLPGDGEETSGNVSRSVNAVIKMLSGQGRRVGTFTLRKRVEGYEQLIKQFSVKSLPCVIVAGRGCGSAAVSGEITEIKLLRAFVQASMPPSSCATPCAPSGCK